MTVLFAIFCGSSVTLALISTKYYSDSLTWLIVEGIVGIVATIVACVYFHEQDKHTKTDA
jgi:hypothetical protein